MSDDDLIVARAICTEQGGYQDEVCYLRLQDTELVAEESSAWRLYMPAARAALAVAEPILRERCAMVADAQCLNGWGLEARDARMVIAAAIRGGSDAAR